MCVVITAKDENQAKKIRRELSTLDKSELTETMGKVLGTIPMEPWEKKESLKDKMEFLQKKDDSYFTIVFDFNKVVPMPPHSDKFFAKGGLGEEERKKYGKNNWYDWSIENWGTKWNSCDGELVDEYDNKLIYEFNTAWACPYPIFTALSKKYHCVVKCYYYDEDFGNNCGCYTADDGDGELEEHDGDYDWLAEHFGEGLLEDHYMVKDENGWHYQEMEE